MSGMWPSITESEPACPLTEIISASPSKQIFSGEITLRRII
jgi:hypothetical protein